LPNKKEYWAFNSVPIVTDDEIPEKLRTKNVKEQLESFKFNPLSVKRPIELDIIEYQNTIDASNAWAVSGEHTETGLPILSNDPHL
jgi:acyl-homoserine lactone acylase PvdQ